MSDDIWSELELLTATLERLQRELARCAGPSRYKNELLTQIEGATKRRGELLAALRKAASR